MDIVTLCAHVFVIQTLLNGDIIEVFQTGFEKYVFCYFEKYLWILCKGQGSAPAAGWSYVLKGMVRYWAVGKSKFISVLHFSFQSKLGEFFFTNLFKKNAYKVAMFSSDKRTVLMFEWN